MDSNLYVNINFVDLLQSQQDTSSIPFLTTQATEGINFQQETSSERKERRTWSPTDDIVLISSWLNMRKDPLVGNEQRSIAFWKRIAAYFAASPKLAGSEKRESSHCKQRWHRINDLVSKFCGAYEAATIEKSSGQNETDVLKLANEIFFTNYKKKFTLEHAWKELRNDQKWCDFSTAKTDGNSKKRKCDEGSQSASSQANETGSAVDEEGGNIPRVLSLQKPVVRRPWVRGRSSLSFRQCRASRSRIWS